MELKDEEQPLYITLLREDVPHWGHLLTYEHETFDYYLHKDTISKFWNKTKAIVRYGNVKEELDFSDLDLLIGEFKLDPEDAEKLLKYDLQDDGGLFYSIILKNEQPCLSDFYYSLADELSPIITQKTKVRLAKHSYKFENGYDEVLITWVLRGIRHRPGKEILPVDKKIMEIKQAASNLLTNLNNKRVQRLEDHPMTDPELQRYLENSLRELEYNLDRLHMECGIVWHTISNPNSKVTWSPDDIVLFEKKENTLEISLPGRVTVRLGPCEYDFDFEDKVEVDVSDYPNILSIMKETFNNYDTGICFSGVYGADCLSITSTVRNMLTQLGLRNISLDFYGGYLSFTNPVYSE